jgi:hypothetical protein
LPNIRANPLYIGGKALFFLFKGHKKTRHGAGFGLLAANSHLLVFVAVVAGGVLLFVLLAADGPAAHGTSASAKHSPGFAANEAAYYGPAYAAGYSAFSLTAPAFGLVLGLGGSTGQHDEGQQ